MLGISTIQNQCIVRNCIYLKRRKKNMRVDISQLYFYLKFAIYLCKSKIAFKLDQQNQIQVYNISSYIFMSIRFIGYESYVPTTPGNFAKGKTKVIRISSEPDQSEEKANKILKYREQLDKQVQQMRKRKQLQKKRQKQQDQRRQRQFYQSLQHSKKHSQSKSPKNVRNFHFSNSQSIQHARLRDENPQQNSRFEDGEDMFHFQSRLAHIGKNKIKLQVPVFQNRADLVNQQDDISTQKRRKNLIQEMDRSLLGAYMAIERSKGSGQIDDELDRFRNRLKTEESRIRTQNQAQNQLYHLPYKNYLYNSPYRFRHKREPTWI